MILTDSEIIEQFKNTNSKEKVFRALMNQYQEKIYWQVKRIVLEHEDTNDVVQNVFIKVWNSLAGFKGESKLSTWLYRIAYNESINFITTKKKMSLSDWELEEKKIEETHSERNQSPQDELYQHLDLAIETLPEKQKLIFKMRYYDELSYEEIAVITGTSVGGLKASYHHAVKKIEVFVKAGFKRK